MLDRLSDWLFLLAVLPMIWFGARFSLGRPRTWWKDPLGWVIMLFNLAVLLLLTLIVLGLGFHVPITEPWLVAAGLSNVVTGTAKCIMLERERYRGRLTVPVYEHTSRYTGPNPTIKGD